MQMNERSGEGGGGGRPSSNSTAEIARRALKALAERKIVPTPETFTDVFNEIAGIRKVPGANVHAVFKELFKDLVRFNRMTAQEAANALEKVQAHDWLAVRETVDRVLLRKLGGKAGSWPQMAVQLLKLVDALHANWTRARKLDAVMRVIEGAGDQPDAALERLGKLIESWGPALTNMARSDETGGRTTQLSQLPPSPAQAAATPFSTPDSALPVTQRYGSDPQAAQQLAQQLAQSRAQADAWKQVALRATRLLELSAGPGTPAATKLRDYAKQYQLTDDAAEPDKIVPRFTDAVAALDRQIDEQHKVRAGLHRLLAMLCDNVTSLTPEEAWLAGQLEPIRALLAGPLAAADLAAAEQTVAGVIAQQANARQSLNEAKQAIKDVLSKLVERSGSMGSTTERFYQQIGSYQRELEKADNFESLSHVIQGLLNDTQATRGDLHAQREELVQARQTMEQYQSRVQQLETELTQVATLVQKDPLTQVLNRRGFEEAFGVETARAARYHAPLSLVMIDLDNFKKLNDTLGHVAGDRALVHLAQTVQALLRPTDRFARLGGEEFAVMFPATDADEAVQAAERVQRELSKRVLEFDGKPWPLTFSAGAADWRMGETLEALIHRADQALYQAKATGKNRVVKAF